MIFVYLLFAVYILSVNFFGFRLLKTQKDAADAGDDGARKSDGKLILAALAGGSPAIFATMFILRYRLTDMLLMIGLPVLSALNFYCYYLGFRGLALIP